MFILHRMSRVLTVLAGRIREHLYLLRSKYFILIFNCLNYYTRLTPLRGGIFSLESLCAFTIKPICIPHGANGKESATSSGDTRAVGLVLGREDFWEGNVTHSSTCLENSDRWGLAGWNPWGQRAEQDWACTYTNTHLMQDEFETKTGPCGHPEQGSPSVSPILFSGSRLLGLYDLPWVSKGQNWIVVNQGREGMQRQGRNSEGTRVESWMKVPTPTPSKGYT